MKLSNCVGSTLISSWNTSQEKTNNDGDDEDDEKKRGDNKEEVEQEWWGRRTWKRREKPVRGGQYFKIKLVLQELTLPLWDVSKE